MTAIEYSRFDWPKTRVSIDGVGSFTDVELSYDGIEVRMLSPVDSSVLRTLALAPTSIFRHDRDRYDLVGAGEEPETWHVDKGCGCG